MGRDNDFLLHISDFREVDEEELRDHSRKNDSVFLFREEEYQKERWEEGEDIRARKHLDYTFIMVKFPFLYDLCKGEVIEEKMQYVDVEFGDQSGYSKVNMPIWQAEEVYQYHNFDGEPENEYLICYSDRILQIDIGWEVTDEDIARIREVICNVK